jgi:putative hydrolase of the HAD superfamily
MTKNNTGEKRYRAVFFDLDNTLWDFSANSGKAFALLYEKYGIERKGVSLEELLKVYHHYNDLMWEEYRQERLDKETLRWKRFYLTFEALGFPDERLARRFETDYLETSKQMTGLVEGATDILQYLQEKYPLYLLTNGFNEVQFTKIRNSGLEPYFDKVITSEMAGALKPHPRFFQYALLETGTSAAESIMIGDDAATDIGGAAAAGIDTVLFNPSGKEHKEKPLYEIKELSELKEIL